MLTVRSIDITGIGMAPQLADRFAQLAASADCDIAVTVDPAYLPASPAIQTRPNRRQNVGNAAPVRLRPARLPDERRRLHAPRRRCETPPPRRPAPPRGRARLRGDAPVSRGSGRETAGSGELRAGARAAREGRRGRLRAGFRGEPAANRGVSGRGAGRRAEGVSW